MAFEIVPPPNFNVAVPDFTQKAAEGAQLRAMLSENALRQALAPGQVQAQQQQLQQQQIQTQMQQMQLRDSQIMTDYLQNGDVGQESGGDFSQRDRVATFAGIPTDDPIMTFIGGLAKKGYSGPGLLATAQNMIQKRQEYNKGTEELQTIQKNDRLFWADQLATLHDAPPEQRGPLLASKLPGLLENSKSDPLLRSYATALNGHPELIDGIYNTVLGENAALDLGKKKAETQEAQTKAQEAAARATGAVTPEMATEQAQKIQVAATEARIHAQVQAATLPLLEDIRQQYANQKDARDKIESTVLKPYQDKLTDITTARATIAQAESNPVAARAAIFKMIGVAQPTGSHRVLPAEISAFKYPGGITDRIQERFKDFLKGEPWTPEIAQAASSFIDGQEAAAQTSLNSGIDRTNELYGTNVGRGLQQTPQGETRTYQGRTYTRQPDGTWKLQ